MSARAKGVAVSLADVIGAIVMNLEMHGHNAQVIAAQIGNLQGVQRDLKRLGQLTDFDVELQSEDEASLVRHALVPTRSWPTDRRLPDPYAAARVLAAEVQRLQSVVDKAGLTA